MYNNTRALHKDPSGKSTMSLSKAILDPKAFSLREIHWTKEDVSRELDSAIRLVICAMTAIKHFNHVIDPSFAVVAVAERANDVASYNASGAHPVF